MEATERYEIRDELRRILASKHFAKTRKRNRFLEFVCEQTLVGNADKLSEYLLGVEVYGRGPDFNPQDDAIVRVQASDIRKSLRDYYAEEGKSDPWRIDLPPGHYIPLFARGPGLQAATVPAAPQGAKLAALPGSFIRQNALVLGLSIACIVLSTVLIVKQFGPRPVVAVQSSAALPAGTEWFWKPFTPPAEPPLIVVPNHPLLRPAHYGDSPATLANGHLIPKSKLGEFRDTVHFRELKEFNYVSDMTDFTGLGEALGLLDFFELFANAGQHVRVKPARLVDFGALKRGNAIVLGGTQGWSGRIFLYQDGFSLHAGIIENKHPRPGEQPVYKPEFDSLSNSLRRDYALVLMLPNLNPEHRILLTYGIYTKGTQAAIEYVTNTESLQELRRQLVALSPDKKSIPKFFQVLLTTKVENDVPGKASFVSARIIPE